MAKSLKTVNKINGFMEFILILQKTQMRKSNFHKPYFVSWNMPRWKKFWLSAELGLTTKPHSNQTSVNPETRRADITDIFGRMYANGKKSKWLFSLRWCTQTYRENWNLKFDIQLPHAKFSHPAMFRSYLTWVTPSCHFLLIP